MQHCLRWRRRTSSRPWARFSRARRSGTSGRLRCHRVGSRERMAGSCRDLPSGTVTFLFTDVEGSTRLLYESGAEAYAAALKVHRGVIRDACGREAGVEVDTQGDAFFFAFPTAPGALAAGQEIVEALGSGPIRVRLGVHTGTPFLTDEGYVGSDVNRAARIAAAGSGGQILVSGSTAALVDADLRDLGIHRFKDLAAPERVFQLGSEEFPALKSLGHTNLPIPATPFLGRERELSQVIELLGGESRLLTLTGPGGIGKTRLALQAAAEASDRFSAGVWWVPLASLRDPALVVTTVEQVLGARVDLARHIGDKSMLLVFDNFEQVVDASSELVALLAACPALEMVVTSRERLRVRGEQTYPVPLLGPDDGEALFVARARSIDPSFVTGGAVAELCSRLDELPLALELAAARTAVFSPEQMLDRLGSRLDLLKGERDADPRQQTLRATIQWSYDLLSPIEQALLDRLSVFADGCSYEASEQVADADPDTLQSLLDKSLVRRRGSGSESRYWMLETIREFAAEQLAKTGERDTTRERHLAFYVSLVVEAEPQLTGRSQKEWFDRLSVEQENVRAALGFACDRADGEQALMLAGSFWRYWWTRGQIDEGERWYEAALAVGDGASDTARARGLFGLAHMTEARGDARRAAGAIRGRRRTSTHSRRNPLARPCPHTSGRHVPSRRPRATPRTPGRSNSDRRRERRHPRRSNRQVQPR